MRRVTPPWALAVGLLPVACNALWGIDDLDYAGTAGATTSDGGAAGGGAAGHGGATAGAGGQAGDGGAGGRGGSGCLFGPFEPPTLLAGVNSSYSDWDPSISSDGLTLYFASQRAGGQGSTDIWYAKRSQPSAAFDTPQNLSELNTSAAEVDAEISADGRTIYWAVPSGAGDFDLWYATRPNALAPFESAQELAELNTDDDDRDPAISVDGLTLVFASDRLGGAGGLDLWCATRPDIQEPFGPPVQLPEVSDASVDSNPALSADALTLYFSSNRAGGAGTADIWVATRLDRGSPFDEPQNVAELNSTDIDSDPCVSADGLTMYLGSDRAGTGVGNLFYATRTCR